MVFKVNTRQKARTIFMDNEGGEGLSKADKAKAHLLLHGVGVVGAEHAEGHVTVHELVFVRGCDDSS